MSLLTRTHSNFIQLEEEPGRSILEFVDFQMGKRGDFHLPIVWQAQKIILQSHL